MTRSDARWSDIKALFDNAIDRPASAQDALIAASGLDSAGRAEVRSLLAHHQQATVASSFVIGAASLLAEDTDLTLAATHAGAGGASTSATVGQRLGAWEIVRAIGSGGMGDVYEARRADGSYEGRAAVKLLKRGMDSQAVLKRFALERQALARLSHPHIARLLDAGASSDGLPYFVMEHVLGQPIDRAVRGLALEARLALFGQLAQAVAHAHRNLLVHRDLKPGNVLVDVEGRVKLLDFGIAKALDPMEGADNGDDPGDDAGTRGHTTIGGVRPYTPHHASPEQVRGEPVTTATDIYSLGVLLYQMLTGTRPTGRNATTLAQAARSVLEEAPMRPSRLSAREATDPQWLEHRKRLAGDLDNILLKALAKEPARRYASVDAMAADVQAFLQQRPVSARPATAGYVLAKFVQRNRLAVLTGSLGSAGLMLGLAAALARGQVLGAVGAVALAVGLLLAMVQMRRATLARERAESHVQQLRRVARELVVEYGDAITYVPGGREHQARLLASTLETLQQLVQPDVDDRSLLAEIGVMHARLAHLRVEGAFNAEADSAQAEHHARQAVALCRAGESAARDQPALLRWWAVALVDLAGLTQRAGRPQQALAELDDADGLLQRALSRYASDLDLRRERNGLLMLRANLLYGWDRPHLNRPDDALQCLQQARVQYLEAAAMPSATRAYDVFQVGGAVVTRALILLRLGRWTEALAAAQEAVRHREQACALQPHNRTLQGGLAADRNLLAGLCLDHGDAQRALLTSTAGWASLDRLIDEDPGNQTWTQQRRYLALHHGRALLACSRPADAVRPLQLSADWLVAERAAAAPDRPLALRLQLRLARSWLALEQARQALGQDPGPGAHAALRLSQAALTLLPDPLQQPAQPQPPASVPPEAQALWLLVAECAWALRAGVLQAGVVQAPASAASGAAGSPSDEPAPAPASMLALALHACACAQALGPLRLAPDLALVSRIERTFDDTGTWGRQPR
ncbi:MAG: serine/threonine-protein kinase [Rubrivivax sp.]